MKSFKQFSEEKLGRDKAKDDRLFDCGDKSEINYVVKQYPSEWQGEVEALLKLLCAKKELYHSTHKQVYQAIENELGLEIPVDSPRG